MTNTKKVRLSVQTRKKTKYTLGTNYLFFLTGGLCRSRLKRNSNVKRGLGGRVAIISPSLPSVWMDSKCSCKGYQSATTHQGARVTLSHLKYIPIYYHLNLDNFESVSLFFDHKLKKQK